MKEQNSTASGVRLDLTKVTKNLESFAQAWNDYKERLAKAWEKSAPAFAQFAAALATLPEATREVITYLVPRGWYLSTRATVNLVPKLAAAIRTDSHEDVEQIMLLYARHRQSAVGERVAKLWPERANLVREAVDAHNNGHYALSIPVLLAQADAVSTDLLGASVFSKENGRPVIARTHRRQIAQEPDPSSFMTALFFGPLEILSGMAVSTQDFNAALASDSSFGTLNRHAVLHGLSLDYGTEANELRAILLLDFLCDLKERPFRGEAQDSTAESANDLLINQE